MKELIALKIAFDYVNGLQFDCSFEVNPEYLKKIQSLFNSLPTKAKYILEDVTFNIVDSEHTEKLKGTDKLLGISRPRYKEIYLNLEGINDNPDKDLEYILFHEIGHYLTFFFTDKEKSKYFEIYGQEAVPDQEQDANGFLAWMTGRGNEHINNFWNWWINQ